MVLRCRGNSRIALSVLSFRPKGEIFIQKQMLLLPTENYVALKKIPPNVGMTKRMSQKKSASVCAADF